MPWSFAEIALTLGGVAAGILAIDQVLKANPPLPVQTWLPIPASTDTIPGLWYRWSIVTTSSLAEAQAIFASSFTSLKAWPTISIPTDWPASDQGTNRLRFQGQAAKIVAGIPDAWQPALFELSSGAPT